jgi:hypothetical protein
MLKKREQTKLRKRPATSDDPAQSRAFIEKARDIAADEEHSAADELMERLAKSKPEPRSKKPSDA